MEIAYRPGEFLYFRKNQYTGFIKWDNAGFLPEADDLLIKDFQIIFTREGDNFIVTF